jgi:hypothetical protein
MTTRIITDEHQRNAALLLLQNQSLPITVTIASGKQRTWKQNKLQRLWMNEIAEQLGDTTPEEARGYCKLCIAVPILRAENDDFCEKYDRIIRPMPYEQKLEIMQVPLDFPVTRLMTSKQKKNYLDQIVRHFAEKGVILTDPEQRGLAA